MVIKVGINGFGRIGRIMFRTCVQNPNVEVTAINDPAIDVEYICYLIKFDSTHGNFNGDIMPLEDDIKVNGNLIKIFREKLPSSVQWHLAGVQYVIESSGMFTNYERAVGHLAAEGVRRVVVTAPSVDVPMLIMGVNNDELKPDEKVISSASSTLYCLATIIKVLENDYGIAEGFVTSIHAMTPSLKPLDGLCLRGKHWRDYRSIHQNVIPATTGACKALGKILPQLKDKLVGLAFRVPIVNVSVLDLTVRLNKGTSLQRIVESVENASRTYLKGVLNISNEEAVSSDFMRDTHSCILDVKSSIQHKPNFYKLICWYENEYSYACRVIDTILFCEKQFNKAPAGPTLTAQIKNKNVIPNKKHIVQHPPENFKHFMTLGSDCNAKIMPDVLKNVSKPFEFKVSSVSPCIPFRRKAPTKVSVMNQTTSSCCTKSKSDIFKIVDYDSAAINRRLEENDRDSCVTLKLMRNTNTNKDKVYERLIKAQEDVHKMMRATRELLKKTNVCDINKEIGKESCFENRNIKGDAVDAAKVIDDMVDKAKAKEQVLVDVKCIDHAVQNLAVKIEDIENSNVKKDDGDSKKGDVDNATVKKDNVENVRDKKDDVDGTRIKEDVENVKVKKDDVDIAKGKKDNVDIAKGKKDDMDNAIIKKDDLDNAQVKKEDLNRVRAEEDDLDKMIAIKYDLTKATAKKDDVDNAIVKEDADNTKINNEDYIGKDKEALHNEVEKEIAIRKIKLKQWAQEIAKVKELLEQNAEPKEDATDNVKVKESDTQTETPENSSLQDSSSKEGNMKLAKVNKAAAHNNYQEEIIQDKKIKKKVIRTKSDKTTSVTVILERSSDSLFDENDLRNYSKNYQVPVSMEDSAGSKIDVYGAISDDDINKAAASKNFKSVQESGPKGLKVEDRDSWVSLRLKRNYIIKKDKAYDRLIKAQEEVNKMMKVTQALLNKSNGSNNNKENETESSIDITNIKDDAVEVAKGKEEAVDRTSDKRKLIINVKFKKDEVVNVKVNKDEMDNVKVRKDDQGKVKAEIIQNEEDKKSVILNTKFEECAREIAKAKEVLMSNIDLMEDITGNANIENGQIQNATPEYGILQNSTFKEDTMGHEKNYITATQNANSKSAKVDPDLINGDGSLTESCEEDEEDGRIILKRLLALRPYSVNSDELESETSFEISDVDLSWREGYAQRNINDGCLKVGNINNCIDIARQLKSTTAEYTTKYVITGKIGEGNKEKGESKISRHDYVSTIDKQNVSQNEKVSDEQNITIRTKSSNTAQDIYEKLDSASPTNSDNSFDVNEKKSQVIHIDDLTDSLEDLGRLEKICKIIEISDDLSDVLFAKLQDSCDGKKIKNKKWSFNDLCEKINLDDFCKKVFHESNI